VYVHDECLDFGPCTQVLVLVLALSVLVHVLVLEPRVLINIPGYMYIK